ncbi:MAG: glycosyltransferase family 4 protein [Ginsengibacter sp.]
MANVLSLVPYKIFPAKLGGQKGIAFFNKYFSEFHSLICVTVKDNDPVYADYKVLNILSNSKLRYLNIFYFFTISRIIKKYKISHLIIEHPYYGWLGLLLKIFCKIKMITHSHNIEAQRFKSVGKWWWRILGLYEEFIYGQSDYVFCINEEDKKFIIDHFNVVPLKCSVITYGIEWDHPPGAEERVMAKNYLQNKYAVEPGTLLYLFNGTLDYIPNLNAVKIILDHINPVLLSLGLNYKIIICGKNLPRHMNELKDYVSENIIYAGFVDDISLYFKGVDIFINPITYGGGIKTKLVEALGYDLAAVSTFNGAIGVEQQLCNGKLILVMDDDWEAFAKEMRNAQNITSSVTAQYFEHFYWKNIALKASRVIEI